MIKIDVQIYEGQIPSLVPRNWYFIKDKEITNAILHYTGNMPNGDFMFKLQPGTRGAIMLEKDQAQKLLDHLKLRNLEMVNCRNLLGLPEAEQSYFDEGTDFSINENF